MGIDQEAGELSDRFFITVNGTPSAVTETAFPALLLRLGLSMVNVQRGVENGANLTFNTKPPTTTSSSLTLKHRSLASRRHLKFIPIDETNDSKCGLSNRLSLRVTRT